MPLYSAFTGYGHLAYSSRTPRAQVVYESLREGMGDLYDETFDGIQQGRLYAQAMCIASAQLQLERAANNANPSKATELLALLEQDYQVTPEYGATLEERRAELAARAEASKGCSRTVVEAALSNLLGSDFVDFITVPDPEDVVTWPSSPGTVGVFAAAGAQKKSFVIAPAVSITLTPITVGYTTIAGSEKPIAGESYTVDPDSRGAPERVTILSSTATTITATFTTAHEPGTVATTPHPMWISNQRYNLIRVTRSCAQDPVKVRKINELMARMLRGVSQWGISTTLGFLTPDDPVLGDPRVAIPF